MSTADDCTHSRHYHIVFQCSEERRKTTRISSRKDRLSFELAGSPCHVTVQWGKAENHLHILKERSTFFRSLKRQGESWWQGVGCRLVSYFFGMMHARPKEAIYIQWALSHLYTGGKNSPSFETPEVAVLRWRVTSTAVTWRGVFKQEGTGVQRWLV